MSDKQYGWIENPPNWPPGKRGPATVPAAATIEQRLFFKGLLSEDEAFDYDAASIKSALEWLRSSPPEPFCLFIPLLFPHPPFQVQDPYYSMYRNLELPARVKLGEKTGYEPRFMAAIRREHVLERASEQHWHEVKAIYVSFLGSW